MLAQETLETKLLNSAYPLTIEAGEMKGAGAPILQTAISQAGFVLLGEDHMTHEIPQFAGAVCGAMGSSGGLSAMAFESSPAAAAFVQSTLKLNRKERIDKFSALAKRFPDVAAFLNVEEENDLAAHCAAVSQRQDFRLWGLDQEFVGSAGWILERMLGTKPGPSARAAILRMQAMEHAGAAEAAKTGDPSTLFLLSSPDAEMEKAAAEIAKDGTPATRSTFHELTESRAIYKLQGTHPSESNGRRARLLKQNFLASYKVSGGGGRPQRILLKFGDWHLYKGINPLHQRDLGNFVAEFADGRNATSLHILVLGAKGTHALFAGYDRPLHLEPFVGDQDADYRWLTPALHAQKAGSWTLFDLRPLRFGKLALDADWQRVVYGYDLMVLIPELTPATLVP